MGSSLQVPQPPATRFPLPQRQRHSHDAALLQHYPHRVLDDDAGGPVALAFFVPSCETIAGSILVITPLLGLFPALISLRLEFRATSSSALSTKM